MYNCKHIYHYLDDISIDTYICLYPSSRRACASITNSKTSRNLSHWSESYNPLIRLLIAESSTILCMLLPLGIDTFPRAFPTSGEHRGRELKCIQLDKSKHICIRVYRCTNGNKSPFLNSDFDGPDMSHICVCCVCVWEQTSFCLVPLPSLYCVWLKCTANVCALEICRGTRGGGCVLHIPI